MTTTTISGFRRAPDPAVLILRGDDAGEFLNGQVSNDVASLVDGESRYALLLTPKGKLRADLRIARDGDETLIVCSPEHLPIVQEVIEKFRIGYFFSVEDATGEWALFELLGEEALDPVDCMPETFVPLESPLGMDMLVAADEADLVEDSILSCGFDELEDDDHDVARVLAGVPVFGAELDENTFPAEAALERRAVSFEKGCYVGQETVARMHYKGKPNRHLRILRSESRLTPGAEITGDEGRVLGKVGTSVASADGAPAALAILRREGEPGSVVDVDGVSATVVEIPADEAG